MGGRVIIVEDPIVISLLSDRKSREGDEGLVLSSKIRLVDSSSLVFRVQPIKKQGVTIS